MSSSTVPSSAAAELEQLRSERKLRALTKAEEGTDIYRLPNGVFGFTYAPGLKEVPVYSKQHYHGFEIQRLSNGEVHVVGFVTPAEKAELKDAKQASKIALFPERWEASTELVTIADTRLQPAKKAVTREDGNPFRTLVFPPA
jgi:hypothetical protein